MFPINLYFRYERRIRNGLYIPLCFLLITVKFFFALNSYPLYIPLCFLLIHGSRQLLLYWEISLHSTMFPINPHASGKAYGCNALYIPLCFLLITKSLRPLQRILTLHSTMFPINLFASLISSSGVAALHSTMFPINLRCRSWMWKEKRIFTFHYVSY